MTGGTSAEIERFFADFEDATRTEDWRRYGEMFLPRFMSLDPSAAGSVARDDLIAFLPQRKGADHLDGAVRRRQGAGHAAVDVRAAARGPVADRGVPEPRVVARAARRLG